MAPNRKPTKSTAHARGKMPVTHRQRPASEEHAGELFRVRDRHEVGAPGIVWGDGDGKGLSFADATALKNEVTGSRRSRTARVESMDIEMPEGEPVKSTARKGGDLASSPPRPRFPKPTLVQQEGAQIVQSVVPGAPPIPMGNALAAAQRAAKEAQRRVAMAASDEQRRLELAELAKDVGPVDATEDDEIYGSDIDDLQDGLGSVPSAADLKRAEDRAALAPDQSSPELMAIRLIAGSECSGAILDEIMARYGDTLIRPTAWRQDEVIAFVVMNPRSVVDEFHAVIHDRELRDRARASLNGTCYANDLSPNAVLVLVPVQ